VNFNVNNATLTLHKPATKLAALYLGIIMTISLFFSVNVYQLSMQEFARGYGTPNKIINIAPQTGGIAYLQDRLVEERNQLYADARQRVVFRLVLTNLVILVGGGVLSYYLARRTLKPIEDAHDAQSRFTADASHELRTPLTAMQSETEVALMDPGLTLEKAKKQLASNLEEMGKLTALSDGLLRLAQLENKELRRMPVPVDTVVEHALDRVLPWAEKKHILITVGGAKHVRTTGDTTALTEALVILLDNAVKYSPEKTEISVTVQKGTRQIAIEVADQGAGIKATELPHIFERFYRADAARSKQHVSGYGLGLAIAKNIAGLHGGDITVESTPGKGSRFTLVLPVKAAAEG
jgi:two-component system sensor histidine kinase CiaH